MKRERMKDENSLKQNIKNFSAQTKTEPTYHLLSLNEHNKLSPEDVTEMISPTLSAEHIPVVMPQP